MEVPSRKHTIKHDEVSSTKRTQPSSEKDLRKLEQPHSNPNVNNVVNRCGIKLDEWCVAFLRFAFCFCLASQPSNGFLPRSIVLCSTSATSKDNTLCSDSVILAGSCQFTGATADVSHIASASYCYACVLVMLAGFVLLRTATPVNRLSSPVFYFRVLLFRCQLLSSLSLPPLPPYVCPIHPGCSLTAVCSNGSFLDTLMMCACAPLVFEKKNPTSCSCTKILSPSSCCCCFI